MRFPRYPDTITAGSGGRAPHPEAGARVAGDLPLQFLDLRPQLQRLLTSLKNPVTNLSGKFSSCFQ
jgi:hypothetical protein